MSDWGEGALNNNIGWGKGFNNTISWGSVYSTSYAGETSITGSIAAFTFTINTANTSAGSSTASQFKLPLIASFNGVTSNVDWGDGSTNIITAFNQAEVTHTYSSSGTYTVTITGALRGFRFGNGGDRLKILNISRFGILEVNDNATFWNCANLTSTATDLFTVTTTSLVLTFGGAVNFNQNLTNLNISSVTNLQSFLNGGNAQRFGFANWDINQVTNFADFMLNATGLSTAEYNATLISWNNQAPITGRTITFGGSKYTLGGAAAAARASLISVYGWTITDGGGI